MVTLEFDLTLNGKPVISLTEYTIQSIDFITTKTHDHFEQTRDIAMRLRFQNADVALRSSPSKASDGENETESVPKPDELDSVRNLLVYAVSPYDYQLAYLDGEVSIYNELGQIASMSYKDLFVLSCSEEYLGTRETYIDILMREKVR